MKDNNAWLGFVAMTLLAATPVAAGPFTELGIDRNDPRVAGFATMVVNSFIRGPQNVAVPGSLTASFGQPSNAIGPADNPEDPDFGANSVVSLGDGGSITLGFDTPIVDIPGPDLAVFENTFIVAGTNQAFAELAFVEVSTNGVDFFRFDAVSLTQTDTQLGAFGAIDPTEVFNLAGKHEGFAGVGTPFDLAELDGVSPLLDVSNVNFVRIIDVVGSIDPQFGSLDSLGNLINDPFPTASAGGGFDLDAVARLRAVPEPSSLVIALIGGCLALRRRRQG